MNNLIYRQLYAIALICSLIVCATARAMQNEPADFNGVPWGAPLEDHKQGLTLMGSDAVQAYYRRPADANSYARIDTWRISYRFYKNRFSSATVTTVGINNFNAMIRHLTQAYGEPDTVNPRHRIYTWAGQRASIMTSCDISISCYFEFFGNELRELELAEQGEVPSRTTKDD